MIITVDPEKIKDWKDIFCYNPFHRNVFTLSEEEVCKKVEKLLADGKDPNVSFGYGNRPLCAAIESGCVKTAEKLLEAGADPNGKDDCWGSPLYIAADRGHTEIVRKLLASGAIVDDVNPFCSGSALHAAAEGRHVEIMELLIKAKASIDKRDNSENTPLILACREARKNKTMGIKKLIDAGANVKAKNNCGETPLHALAMSKCSEQECFDVLQWLIDAGADIHAKDKQGRQPLHLAAQYGKVEMVKKLLELGADPWAETKDHVVPLFCGRKKEIRSILLNAMKEHARKRFGQTKTKRVAPIKRVGRRKTDSQKLESERKVIDHS